MNGKPRFDLSVSEARMNRLALVVCIGVFVYHFAVVWTYAVNVPFFDEWAFFNPDALPAGFSLRWLFALHNEHRMVTTKLVVWALFLLNGWDAALHQALNFVVFGLLLAWLYWFARRAAPRLAPWVVLSFLVLLLTPLNIENHSWAFQSVVHFWLLFFLVAAYFLFEESQRGRSLAAGCAAVVLSAYSLAGGVLSGLVLLGAFAVFKLLRARRAADGRLMKRELFQLVAVACVVGGALALWFVGYQRPNNDATVTPPYAASFWVFFLNVVSVGFGFEEPSVVPGVVCLFVVLAPLGGLVWRRGGRLKGAEWSIVVAAAGLLAVLAVTTLGRAGFGVRLAKASRYTEFGMALVPLSALAWALFLEGRRRLRAWVLAGVWVFCLAGSWSSWWEFGDYKSQAIYRVTGMRCLKVYYDRGGAARCPLLHPEDLGERLEAGKRLNASFYRELMAGEWDVYKAR